MHNVTNADQGAIDGTRPAELMRHSTAGLSFRPRARHKRDSSPPQHLRRAPINRPARTDNETRTTDRRRHAPPKATSRVQCHAHPTPPTHSGRGSIRKGAARPPQLVSHDLPAPKIATVSTDSAQGKGAAGRATRAHSGQNAGRRRRHAHGSWPAHPRRHPPASHRPPTAPHRFPPDPLAALPPPARRRKLTHRAKGDALTRRHAPLHALPGVVRDAQLTSSADSGRGFVREGAARPPQLVSHDLPAPKIATVSTDSAQGKGAAGRATRAHSGQNAGRRRRHAHGSWPAHPRRHPPASHRPPTAPHRFPPDPLAALPPPARRRKLTHRATRVTRLRGAMRRSMHCPGWFETLSSPVQPTVSAGPSRGRVAPATPRHASPT